MQETILYLDNVTVSFDDGFKAIDNLSLYVKTNELRCIIGPNGAGKTTVMQLITGYLQASQGRIIIDQLSSSDNLLTIQKKIGYLPENNPLYYDMTPYEYLTFIATIRLLIKYHLNIL